MGHRRFSRFDDDVRFVAVAVEPLVAQFVLDSVGRTLSSHSVVVDDHEEIEVACAVGLAASDAAEPYDPGVVADVVNESVADSPPRRALS